LETVEVLASISDRIDGRRVTFIDDDTVAMNRHGQIAASVFLSNAPAPGATGAVLLLTPDLLWRTPGNGDWDEAGNWTVSLRPGDPHRVFIDSAADVVVDGPAGPVTVRQLTVGGGAGRATLTLGGGVLTAANGVLLAGNGTLAGAGMLAGTLLNRGRVAPGSSAGAIVVDGDFVQEADGALEIEILLLDSFDVVHVLGTAFLGGLLSLTVDAAYAATAGLGDSFTVLTWAARDGAFAAIDGLRFGPGFYFAPVYGETGLSLVVTAIPVPEPASLVLLLAALAGLAGLRLRATGS
jgi:hypothetical protein